LWNVETSHVKHHSHLQKSFIYQIFNCNSGNIFFIRKAAIKESAFYVSKSIGILLGSPTMSFNILKDIFSSEPMDFLDLRLPTCKRGIPWIYWNNPFSITCSYIWNPFPFHWTVNWGQSYRIMYTHTVNIIIHIYSLI